jgi:riboflavin synthase
VTVTHLGDQGFAADLMGETLQRTALGALTAGAPVNLERALTAGSRFGGHIVQGHVDGVGTVTACTPHDAWTVMAVTAPGRLAPYLVEKGSVAVDGTSLTVMGVRPDGGEVVFEVGLIPHTLAVTVLGRRRPGDAVNLEVDVVAKYVERLLSAGVATPYAS